MDKDLEIIFRDLEEEGLMKVLWSRKIPKVRLCKNIKLEVDKVSIGEDDRTFIVKHSMARKGIVSVASSKIYREAGIYTPQVYLLRAEDKRVANTIQEDVTNINGLETILPQDDLEFMKIGQKLSSKFKWQLFYDRGLESQFLKFMTPACLEQLKNIFLADEVRTDIDRHHLNYFLYKRKGKNRYEGIIVFDLDMMRIYMYCGDLYTGNSREDFKNFLVFPYESATPQMWDDNVCYKQRVVDICELIQDGVLSDGNIETLKKILQTDFPNELMQACKQQRLSRRDRNKVVSPVEYLWEYNRNTIGKELGL